MDSPPISSPQIFVAGALVILISLAWLTLGGTAAEVAGPPENGDLKPAFTARVAALEERLLATPAAHDVRLELARLLNDAHRHDEAIAHFERYVQSRPDDRQGWLDLANGYGTLERWDEAERASLALLERHPGDAAATYNLGAIAANRRAYDEARSWWRQLVQSAGDDHLAEQAEASLARLDALASGAASRAELRYARSLPEGHPPIAAGTMPMARAYLQSRPPAAPR